MLDPVFCRQRQRALLGVLHERGLDAAVLGLPEHVYWSTGHRPFWLCSAAVVLRADGHATLVCANEPDAAAAADAAVAFKANFMGTQRQEQPAVVADHVVDLVGTTARVGTDTSAVSAAVANRLPAKPELIDPDLWHLRRPKYADELILMRRAVACTVAMYDRARQVIEPGLDEVALFAHLHAAAVESAGEPLSALLGNDFACGVAGGPPRAGNRARAGQLWVLDLGPAYRGYFADNCRAIAVDRRPTDVQLKAYAALAGVFPIVEAMAKPGVRCRDLFAAADEHLKATAGRGQPHHLGHGVGLQPHEFPHLNLGWDDTLVDGEVFTVEPGLYGSAFGGPLDGGLRLENQYRVTPAGVENLVDYPLDLA